MPKRSKPYKLKMAEIFIISNNTKNRNFEKVQADSDESLQRIVIPVLVVYSIIILFGFIGNMIVCYIFGRRMTKSVQNCLIVVLACVDTMICGILVPIDLAALYSDELTINNNARVCKTIKFIDYACLAFSVTILNLIAYDRYRKICFPFKKQIRIRDLNWIFVPCLLVVCAGASPTLYMNGLHRVGNITHCDLDDTNSSQSLFIYFLLQLVLGLSLTSVFFALYWATSRALKRQLMRTMELKRVKPKLSSPFLQRDNVHRDSEISKTTASTKQVSFAAESPKRSLISLTTWGGESLMNLPFLETLISKNGTSSYQTDIRSVKWSTKSSKCNSSKGIYSNPESSSSTVNRDKSKSTKKHSLENSSTSKKSSHHKSTPENHNKNQNSQAIIPIYDPALALAEYQGTKEKKAARIMLVVVVAAVIFWLPHFIAQLLDAGFIYFGHEIRNNLMFIIIGVFKRFHYLNSTVNPIIYGWMNVKFRVEVLHIFSDLSHCRII